jgi:hypothetical protein
VRPEDHNFYPSRLAVTALYVSAAYTDAIQ